MRRSSLHPAEEANDAVRQAAMLLSASHLHMMAFLDRMAKDEDVSALIDPEIWRSADRDVVKGALVAIYQSVAHFLETDCKLCRSYA
jgi:hypothetical protein